MRKSVYKAGKKILREGEKGSEAYVIVDGTVEIYKRAFDGSEIVLAKLSKNQMFGEVALIDPMIPRTANVRALVDTTVAIITQDSFNTKIANTDASVKSILKVLAKRIADSNELTVSLYSKIDEMVQAKIGQALEKNKQLTEEAQIKDEKITALEAEIEELKASGPPKTPTVKTPTAKKTQKEGQKLDKDRSMKLSLKDLDKIREKQND